MASKLAVCQLNDRIAPRFDQCPELVLVTLDNSGAVKEKKVLPIANLKPQDVADLLSRLDVKTLICGGVKEDSQQALKKFNIELIDNIIGNVQDVLTRYSKGKLNRGNTLQ
ncbi:MAG: NifB/NifX family molybdenum-iron cluster-binding protein [Thermodesulfobacteriota bacterium]|nr:NifB/NifX family molybdenum-iron cluster-binding protein [Thermodesulfobacteriota bacterium]